MMIPVSIAVSIVLLQNLSMILPRLYRHAITPCGQKGYGKSRKLLNSTDRADRRNLSGIERISA
jgi:hypothetical protein